MSGDITRNEFTRMYRHARLIGEWAREKVEPAPFLLWEEVAERTFKRCVEKKGGAVMCASDFMLAMEFYCMNVMKVWPPIYPLRNLPIEEESFFILFFRKKGLEPVRYLVPRGECWWKGVYVHIPEKWYQVKTDNLKMEVIKWQISESGEKVLVSRSFK